MPIFALINIDQVKGKIKFFKLEIDGICEFDNFCKELESTKEGVKVLKTIYAIIDSASNLKHLPRTKFRELKGRKLSDKIKDYELKKGDNRIYMFMDSGYVVVFAGTKNKQNQDIAKLRRIKFEYKETTNDNQRGIIKKQ